jgi:anti-sigma regulatory factor (Ser/Thr protein kinase)
VGLRAGGHLVHFYDHDDDLSARVVDSLRGALADGDVAIIIAIPAHRAAFAAGLARAGVELDAARARGTLIELDAAGTLAQITADGAPDAVRFDRVVGTTVRNAAASGRRVWAYGEMVALLWEAGSVELAIDLERLWNDLRRHAPFTLLCGYPSWVTTSEESGTAFRDVCAAHSHVTGAAPGTESADTTRRFSRSFAAPAQARSFVAGWLTALGHFDAVDTAELTVSELATNAIAHARSDFTVSLARSSRAIRIIVGDASTDAPMRKHVSASSPRGRGLSIVEAVTSAMGHDVVDGGKLVWADIAIGC